jgi:flavin reductase (DIM6/NTAB) family NADH-FMN oxidoreductase RutF
MANGPADAVLGRVTSGIYILTIRSGERATGMLASWVMQAGFDPPMVTVAVKHGRYVCDWLSEGKPFVLHVVGESQKSLLKHFAQGFEPGQPAFEGLDTKECSRGVPVLTAALGYLECEPVGHTDSEDHRVFLGKVGQGSITNLEKPMVHIRSSGGRY